MFSITIPSDGGARPCAANDQVVAVLTQFGSDTGIAFYNANTLSLITTVTGHEYPGESGYLCATKAGFCVLDPPYIKAMATDERNLNLLTKTHTENDPTAHADLTAFSVGISAAWGTRNGMSYTPWTVEELEEMGGL